MRTTRLGDVPGGDEDWQDFSDSETEDGDCTVWRRSGARRGNLEALSGRSPFAVHRGFAGTRLPFGCTLEFFNLLDRSVGSISAHRRTPAAAAFAPERLAPMRRIAAVNVAPRGP
ncbi:MAG: hypothetical protein F4X35_08560 [Alphaproteobacteria bacterium]|nr:hypothetical protein [Alphaproteobacteria bacterium]